MIVVDVETTGDDPAKHSIVSIGAVDFLDTKRTFYIENRIWEGAVVLESDPLEPQIVDALSINGFTFEQINDPGKPSLKDSMQRFLEWVKECKSRVIAGHNPYFDAGFLKSSAKRSGLLWEFQRGAVDLHTAAYVHMIKRGLKPPKLSGSDCMVYTGIPSEPKPHNALNGALWEAEAFSRIIHGKGLLEQFKQYPIPDYLLP